MRGRAKVLIVDDEALWLDLFAELLKELELEVVKASSYEQAVDFINKDYFHILISDVRLVDTDDKNEQGLKILAYIDEVGLDDVITKVVVTGYGNVQMSRQSFKKYNVYDFISKYGSDGKGFDEDDFKKTINLALKEKVNINTDVTIKYVHGLSPDEMVNKIQNSCGETRVDILKWELDDLIRKLFPDADKLIISPVSGGHSRSGVVKVDPFYSEKGQAASRIVKFGLIGEIEQETKNFEDIKRFTSGQRYTHIEFKARTRLFGGVVYSLVEKVRSFNDFYSMSSSDDICSVYDDLFQRTCRKWYENRSKKHTLNLLSLYWEPARTTYDELLACFEHMYPRYVNKPRISFPDIEGTFINPIYHEFLTEKPLYLPTHTAITHGDLNGENLLVDRDNHTWLIDFYRTGEGHIFRDFISLEATLKFQLYEEEDLSVLYEFEKVVQTPKKFSEKMNTSVLLLSSEADKALDTIDCSRQLAGRVIQPSVEMQDYYAGLFYQTLNLIRYYQLLQFKQRKYYILLSAAMLCEKLENWEEW